MPLLMPKPSSQSKLSHVDAQGAARMVDVGHKAVTQRTAIAEAWVLISAGALKAVRDNAVKKGDVLAAARIAGVMGAKKTHELIPLCHPLKIDSVAVELLLHEARTVPAAVRCDLSNGRRAAIFVRSTVKASDRTGVEMEALTACAVASLTIHDMLKAIDKGIIVSGMRLVYKTGGKSGSYRAKAFAP